MVTKRNELKTVFCVGALLLNGVSPSRAQGEIQRTKEFVVMGYQGILFELRSQEGPYLRTLTDLLKTNPDERDKTIEQIRSLSKTNPNIMDFAEQVIKLQSQQNAGSPSEAAQIPLPTGPNVYEGDRLENALNHLTRGMRLTVITKGGGQYSGQFEEYTVRRLWLKGASRQSFQLDDILAIDAPRL